MHRWVQYLGLPINVSSGKEGVDNLIFFVHLLMAGLFIGWISYFVLALYKFNKRRHPTADHEGVKTHASTWIEGIVALIEAALLFGLAIPLWAKTVDTFPKGKDVTVIKVIGQQFLWNGWYPGSNGVFVTQNEKLATGANPFGFITNDPNYKQNFTVKSDLYVPVNKPVVAYISSLDVIHCFTVRPMRVTQDAIPGMLIPAWFTPVKEGTFQIYCAQLCGSGHYGMRGTVNVLSQQKYDEWFAAKEKAAAMQ
jgi:cytochrome c oxidase subunit 2